MRLVVTPVTPRQPAPRGTATTALTNVVGWFTLAVALWAGLSGAVPLWVGAVISLAGVPAAAWGPERATTRALGRPGSCLPLGDRPGHEGEQARS